MRGPIEAVRSVRGKAALGLAATSMVLLAARGGIAAPARGLGHGGPVIIVAGIATGIATDVAGIATGTATDVAGIATGTATDTETPVVGGTATGTASPGVTATVAVTGTAPIAGATPSHSPAKSPAPRMTWAIRSVDTMKLSRDTRTKPLADAQIAALVRLDARLHLSHVTVDVYYDDPGYMQRWVRAVRAAHLHVWFRAHWYAWETHREQHGMMTPDQYIEATRLFLQEHVDLVQNGDIFDFCPEPENGAYWFDTYGNGWSWRNPAAKTAFNSFIRSGVYMASTTLANRGRAQVLVTAISVNESIATRLLSKPTVARLGTITLDLYPEGSTIDPATAAARVLKEIERVHRRWNVPVLIGEHGYSRDRAVNDATQARVLSAELTALDRLPYLRGLNYWVDAGGARYGGYTNLYSLSHGAWTPRPAAAVLARVFADMTR